MANMNSKTFICYSHKDRERFVSEFARKLIAKGIDVFIDELDIHPGDSLPRKVFEEGIRNSSNFIVVLSESSIESKWVNEELDAGIIKRIEEGSRLIPVVIDDIDQMKIPSRIKHIYRVHISNIDSYENELSQISNIILGNYITKIKNPQPSFHSSTKHFPKLGNIDSTILTSLCEIAVESDYEHVSINRLLDRIIPEITVEDCKESLEILESKHYMKLRRVISDGIGISTIELYTSTILEYIKNNIGDLDEMIELVASTIQNHRCFNSEAISEILNFKHLFVKAILRDFEAKNYISASKAASKNFIFRVTPIGNRYFRELLK